MAGCGRLDAASRECGRETGNQERTRGGCSLGRMHLTVKRGGWLKKPGLFFPENQSLGWVEMPVVLNYSI